MSRSGPKAGRPQGRITRGTTNINRLRRVDRAMAADPRIRMALDVERPLAVDLGYGGRPDTAVEMATRLRRAVPSLDLVGLEIDPDRIVAPRGGVRFAVGGFELAGLRPNLVRAFNVLRQYDEAEVRAAWRQMQDALAPGGLIVEGTCDEIGRRCCWILLDATGPQELTLSWSPAYTQHPSELAARLPKALIHHNVAGEAIHELLVCADRCWDRAASHEAYGPRDRWRYAREMMRDSGVTVTVPRGRRVDNMLSVPWDLVAPD